MQVSREKLKARIDKLKPLNVFVGFIRQMIVARDSDFGIWICDPNFINMTGVHG